MSVGQDIANYALDFVDRADDVTVCLITCNDVGEKKANILSLHILSALET